MRRRVPGFTLVEMLIVLSMVALLLAIALPKVANLRNRSNMRTAKDHFASAVATARAAAIQKGRTAEFHLSGNRIWARVDTTGSSNWMTVLREDSLDRRYDVTVTIATNPSDSVIAFDPRGFGRTTADSGAVYTLTNASLTETVCLSFLGVVRKDC